MSRRMRKALLDLDLDLEDWEEDHYEEDDYDAYSAEPVAAAPAASSTSPVPGHGAGCAEPNGQPASSAAGNADTPCDGEEPDCADVCAICLGGIAPEDLAIVKGCEHTYCVNCILRWALYKEAPWCPQCKAPFNYLYTHRTLDGSLSDCPVEDSVCLLKRAAWFVEHINVLERGKAVSGADEVPPEWAETYYEDAYGEDYDDEEIEQYYFSRAAGRARIVLGNRRMGENGYQRSGRMYARPANNSDDGPSAPRDGAGKVKGKTPGGNAGAGNAVAPAVPGGGGSSKARVAKGTSVGSGVPTPQAEQQGRRAKRNARRAAADAALEAP